MAQPRAEAREKFVPVTALVENMAAIDPAAVAIRHGGVSMSRGALIERSRRVAGAILGRGIMPGSVVAVRLDRSIDHIVACLAILRAGSAFMSIDPNDPPDRARRLIANADAAMVITDASRAADHPGVALCLDEVMTGADYSVPLPAIESEHLAYVAHTSGSTGEPNAAEITHVNLANLVGWAIGQFSIEPTDRVSLALGLGFDAAIFELWPALAAGAALHIIDDVVRASPDLLRRQLLDDRITIATVPTLLAERLIAADWSQDTTLRYLLTGGDVLRSRPREGLPFQLVNNYGPTECTCEATCAIVSPRPAPGIPPIGRPISGVAVYLLDNARQPVAPGEEGEIWIGGASVGRGYRNNAALTDERFRPDPFADRADARMYRTGDRGRLLPNGELAFCGRSDRQIKIAGVRIELDEIATVLERHPGVETAIVSAREEGRGGKSLVAHVLATNAMVRPDAIELRRFLLDRLPRAYVPNAFVSIDAVPLTANGKIDHAALPTANAPTASAPRREAVSAAERTVIEIVGGVLGRERVSLDDNFFLLGGQSLQATEVVVRSREAFGVTMTITDLFASDTIGDFADAIFEAVARCVATMSDADVRAALGR